MKTALVLGANGGVGGETARALLARGWQVRGLTRTPRSGAGIDWRIGDAMVGSDVLDAAQGVDAIVHAVNPPGYRNWATLVMPMLENSIAAARANDARLALPGTIYNYDPATTPVAHPDSPQMPRSRKGAIRKAMEARIEASGVRSLILRAGDFFGPRPGSSWLSQGMVRPGKPVTSILSPGFPGVGHAWAYLPDVGETFARLIDRDADLPRLARYHIAGYWDPDDTGMTEAIRRTIGRQVPVRRLPWRLLPLIAPFNPTMREMIEMKDYWRRPVRLDNGSLVGLLGEEPYTPIDQAMRTTLSALGCG
ncbi:hypothetical protein DMC47_01050 [Nostoc sp. 3335mG]|nr:hypothetical protein DMC47_01050 [Nostoc sp. 3335mG]